MGEGSSSGWLSYLWFWYLVKRLGLRKWLTQESVLHVNTKTQVQPPESSFKKLSVVILPYNTGAPEMEPGSSWGLLAS